MIKVDLFHDLLELSLKEHLLTQMLLEALLDFLYCEDAIVVRVQVLKDRKQFILLLLGVHTVCYVGKNSLLKLTLAVEVFQLC